MTDERRSAEADWHRQQTDRAMMDAVRGKRAPAQGGLVEELALAILNSDRAAGGWPEVASRDNIPDSDGYVRNATAILPIIAARIAEREAVIVAWLRASDLIGLHPVTQGIIADVIERGDWPTTETNDD